MPNYTGIPRPPLPAGYKYRNCRLVARRSLLVNDVVSATTVRGAIFAHLRRVAAITCTAEPATAGGPLMMAEYDWGTTQWLPWKPMTTEKK